MVYLEVEQPTFSATCDSDDTVPAAVHCAGAGVDVLGRPTDI